MSEPMCFTLSGNEDDPNKLDSIFFHDEFSIREVLPYELNAFLVFKDNMEMMCDESCERAFITLVEDAKNLEESFMKCMEILTPKQKDPES